MVSKIQSIRGMHDILPAYVASWQKLETVLRTLARQYGYQEIRFPILEKTELFKRCIGDATDIVEKEMYSFLDRNHENLSLRPEGTAACVRAGIEHGLLYKQIQRLWYSGPMFRHERPQKGRYRQFHQFGVEVFGLTQPEIDAELILMTARLWRELNLGNRLSLQINSLGSSGTREAYRSALVSYFNQFQEQLDDDSRRRLLSNPLRILDSKNPELRDLINNAPRILDFLDEESGLHFASLQTLLEDAEVCFAINPFLVRGLDYYNKTIFEWVMPGEQGMQNTVCAGGRYDRLVEQLGGHATPAAGFAIGLERLIDLIEPLDSMEQDVPDLYFITIGGLARQQGLILAEDLRTQIPGISIILDSSDASVHSQCKRAYKTQAGFALLLGEDEINSSTILLRYLLQERPQEILMRDVAAQRIKEVLAGE